MSSRLLLAESALRPEVRQTIAAFHADVVANIVAALAQHRVVLVGMAQNPFCRRARNLLQRELARHGTGFADLEYGSYLSQWKPRLAIKLWSGWSTFPQIYVDSTLIGGYSELQRAVTSGDWGRWMATVGAVRS